MYEGLYWMLREQYNIQIPFANLLSLQRVSSEPFFLQDYIAGISLLHAFLQWWGKSKYLLALFEFSYLCHLLLIHHMFEQIWGIAVA